MPSSTLAAAAAFLLDDSLPAAAETLGALMTDANKLLPASSLAATAPKPGVPALRFPEFAEAAPWELKKFGDLFKFFATNSFSRDKLTYEQGAVKNIHYGDIHTKFQTHFDITKEQTPYVVESQNLDKIKPESYCQEGDIIIADASEDEADIGKNIELIHLNDEKLIAGLHTILARPQNKDFQIGFMGHLLKSNIMRKQIVRESQGTKVLGISAKRLAKIDVVFPTLPEQEKIAACLSALDAKISSAAAQLTQLHAHKQGLLQQLFPAQGQSAPKLRFPEFAEAAPWEVKRLGDVATIKGGKRLPKGHAVQSEPTDFPYIRVSDMTESGINVESIKYITAEVEKKISNYKIYKDDLYISVAGSIGLVGAVPIQLDGANLTENANKIICHNIFNQFLLQQLKTPAIQNSIQNSTTNNAQPKLSLDKIRKLPIGICSVKEQQKIAACLSALDAKVLAQAEQVRLLQAHKQGLMQQLFPSVA